MVPLVLKRRKCRMCEINKQSSGYDQTSNYRKMHSKLFREALYSEKHVLNMSDCGIGKTRELCEFIVDTLYPKSEIFKALGDYEIIVPQIRFVIAVPTHNQAEGWKNIEGILLKNNIKVEHYYGKGQKIRNKEWEQLPYRYCMQTKEYMEFPGCSFNTEHLDHRKYPSYIKHGKWAICPFREECEYKKMLNRCIDASVIITPIESFDRFLELPNSLGEIPQTILFLDEGIDTKIMYPFKNPRNPNNPYLFSLEELETYGQIGDIIPNEDMKTSALDFYDFKPKTKLKINCLFNSKISNYFRSNENIVVYKSRKNKYAMYGKKVYNFDKVERLIYCDATADASLVSYLTGIKVEDFTIVNVKVPNTSQTLGVSGNWFKQEVNKNIEYLSGIIYESSLLGLTGVIAKNEVIENNLKQMLPSLKNIDFIHYGESRGSNNFDKPYRLVFQIGTFAYTPLICTLLKLVCQLDKDQIQIIMDADNIQAYHRTRASFRLTKTLLFLKSSIISKIKEKCKTISYKSIQYAYSISMNQIDELGLSKKVKKDTIYFKKWWNNETKEDKEIAVKILKHKGLSGSQITEETGIPKRTVYNILRRLES